MLRVGCRQPLATTAVVGAAATTGRIGKYIAMDKSSNATTVRDALHIVVEEEAGQKVGAREEEG